VAALPEYWVERDIKKGLLPRVLFSSFIGYVSYPSHPHLPSKVRCFIDFLAQYFGEISRAKSD
jgi:DNA-binding transcriptional LysR family regulator